MIHRGDRSSTSKYFTALVYCYTQRSDEIFSYGVNVLSEIHGGTDRVLFSVCL